MNNVVHVDLSRRSFLKGAGAISLAALGAATLASCSPSGESNSTAAGSKVFKVAMIDPKQTIDPQKNNNAQCATLSSCVCEPLLYWNEDNKLVPCLAADMPKWSEDGMTLTFKLKEGVKFSNGADLTTEDVKYTFERLFKPETAGVNNYMFNAIKGAKDIEEGKATELTGLVVDGPLDFHFELETPFALLEDNLGVDSGAIFPKEACEKAGDKWGLDGNLIGTGPYVLTKIDGQGASYKPNESYHGGKPALDGIEVSFIAEPQTQLMAFKKGDVDQAPLGSALLKQAQEDPELKDCIRDYFPLGTNFIGLNEKNEDLKDVRVRKALSLAINREELIDTVLNGSAIPCNCYLNPNIPGHDDQKKVLEYNPEKAKQLLAEAGKTNIKLVAKTRTAGDTSVMTAVQNYWKQIGVDLEIQRIDVGVWAQDWQKGNLEVFYISWHPLYADGDDMLRSFFTTKEAAEKSVFYSNPKFDELCDKAITVDTVEGRAKLYKEADDILIEQDMACVPLCWMKLHFLAKPDVEMKIGNLLTRFNQVKMK